MSERQINLLIEVIIGELCTQSRQFSDAADAPEVWMSSPEFMSIDGAAVRAAIAELRAARVNIPMALHRAAHALEYAAREVAPPRS
jgi:hypothetical protein